MNIKNIFTDIIIEEYVRCHLVDGDEFVETHTPEEIKNEYYKLKEFIIEE